jgi:hypothetical protein
LLILLAGGSQAAWSAVQQATATVHERDAAALRDVRAGLMDMPGSQFFNSWDNVCSLCAYAVAVCTPDEDDRASVS